MSKLAQDHPSHEAMDDGQQPMAESLSAAERERYFMEHHADIVLALREDPPAERQVHALPTVHVRHVLNQDVAWRGVGTDPSMELAQPAPAKSARQGVNLDGLVGE